MKYSAIEHPVYGAIYCIAAGSAAEATTTIVYSIAPDFRSSSTIRATFPSFCPIATYTQVIPRPFWFMMASIAT